MKLEKGMIVKLKEDLVPDSICYGIYCSREMAKYAGKSVIVSDILDFEKAFMIEGPAKGYYFTYEMIDTTSFTLDVLKPGMIVECRNGRRYYIDRERKTAFSSTGFIRFSEYNKDLTYENYNEWDIVAVYAGKDHGGLTYRLDSANKSALIWKREDTKEMTVAEIEKKLGYKIKIVKE